MDNYENVYNSDQWQNISQPVVKTAESNEESLEGQSFGDNTQNKKHRSRHPVLTLQLTISLCVLLFLFIVKFLGAPLYDTIMSWYSTEISKSVIYSGDSKDFDFSFLTSSADES